MIKPSAGPDAWLVERFFLCDAPSQLPFKQRPWNTAPFAIIIGAMKRGALWLDRGWRCRWVSAGSAIHLRTCGLYPIWSFVTRLWQLNECCAMASETKLGEQTRATALSVWRAKCEAAALSSLFLPRGSQENDLCPLCITWLPPGEILGSHTFT